jgi:hypothetical protein
VSAIGLDNLDRDPASEQEKQEHLKLKRRAVHAFVDQVYLVRGKDPQITWTMDELNDL